MRDGPAADDPTRALRILLLHRPDRFLRAQKRPGEVHRYHGAPLFALQIFHGYRGRSHPGIVEQDIQTLPNSLATAANKAFTFVRLANIGLYRQIRPLA